MTLNGLRFFPVRMGIALGHDGMHAVRLGLRMPRSMRYMRLDSITEAADHAEYTAVLGAALNDLRDATEGTRGILHFALLPPLVDLRRLEMPRLRDSELRTVIARDVRRYFPSRGEPKIVAIRRIGRRRKSSSDLIAAAAPAWLLKGIEEAAAEAGWRVGSVIPAHAAWSTASREFWPELNRGQSLVLVRGSERFHSLILSRHGMDSVRRFSGTCEISKVVKAVARDDEDLPAVVIAEENKRSAIIQALDDFGAPVVEQPEDAQWAVSPGVIAAAFAARVHGPKLLTERAARARKKRVKRRTALYAAAAVALLTISGAVDAWGVSREIDRVRERSNSLANTIAAARDVKHALAYVNDRLRTLSRLERTAPRWSNVLTAIAEGLPVDAHLVALRATEDSLVIQARAEQPARAFSALSRLPMVQGLRFRGSIRHERLSATTTGARFTLITRLSRPPMGARP